MLPEKPWKSELLARLLAGLFICALTGPLLGEVARVASDGTTATGFRFYALAGGSLAFSAAALWLTLRRWHEEKFAWNPGGLCACLFVSLNLAAWAHRLSSTGADPPLSPWQMVLSPLTFQGAALLLTGWFLRQHQVGWAAAFGFTRPGLGRAVLIGFLLALLAVPLGWLVQALCAKALALLHHEAREQRLVEFLRLTASWPLRVYLGFAALVLAPVAEETLFRGVLYPAVKRFGFPRAALWGTSLLFAASHANLASFVPLVFFAAALTLIYEKTGNLLAPIVAHSGFNAANFAALYLVKQAGQPN